MPNHITNVVKVTHKSDSEKIKFFIQDVQGEERLFDFNKIIPTPDDVYQGDISMQDRVNTEGRNWYDWNIQNRGTKWNAYGQYRNKYIDDVRDDDTEEYWDYHTIFVFDTARSTPGPIREALAKKYKHLDFYIEYADEDIGSNCWVIHIKDGKLTRVDKDWDDKFALYVKGKSARNRLESVITEVPKEQW